MSRLMEKLHRDSSGSKSPGPRTESREQDVPLFVDKELQHEWNDTETYGLLKIWPGQQEVTTDLDIVAVHGLNGDPYRTWTENGKMWLRDFLPQALPQARVFTYGYNSGIAFTGSASRVDDYARILLERLRARRREFPETKRRPLIFICHSLGGIIVKKALILAHERSERYLSITNDTFGIMFLGTPHQGSDVAFWSHCLGSIADVVLMGSIRTKLLQDLKPKSETLCTICSQFVERSRPLRIFSIYERLKIKGMAKLIVDKTSAVMNLPNEIPLPIEADHRSMCRFGNSASERFQMVLDCLKEMVEDSLQIEQTQDSPLRSEFLRSLNAEDPETLLRRVPRPTSGTCEWVLGTEEFKSWRYNDQPKVLWIWGPPGVGKTTILRSLMETLRRSLQRDDRGSMSRSTVAFCFSGNSHWRLRDELYALASIIHQVLSQNELGFRYLKDKDLRDFIYEDTDDPSQLLWSILTTVLQRSKNAKFWIVLDAVDEFAEDAKRNLLGHIGRIVDEDLGNKVRFLISDRMSCSTQIPKSQAMSIQVHDRQPVLDDIHRFISANVGNLCSEGMIPWRYQTHIEEALIDVSESNFLQATLAWTNFSAGVTYWSPQVINKKLEIIRKISKEAEAYYCSLLARIPEDSHHLARAGFTWVLGARKPLTVTELQHAVAISAGQESWADLMESLGFNFEVQFDQAFGYLLRIDPDRNVRFAHQTVKDLLTSPVVTAERERSELLARFHIDSSDIDAELAKACIVVLSFRDFSRLRKIAQEALSDQMQNFMTSSWRSGVDLSQFDFSRYDDSEEIETSTEDNPVKELKRTLSSTSLNNSGHALLSYCVAYWNYHCVESASNRDVVQSLSEFVLLRQSHFFHLVAMLFGVAKVHEGSFWSGVNQFARLPPLHFLMRIGDHPAAVQNLFSKAQSVTLRDCNRFSALTWAALEERHKSIEILLSQDDAPINSNVRGRDGLIHSCCRAGVGAKLLQRLLDDPRTDINAKSSDGWTILHWCMSRKAMQSIAHSLLARKNLDINAVDRSGKGYLYQVFNDGHFEELALKIISRPDMPANWFQRDFKSPSADDMGLEPKSYLDMASFLQWYEIENVVLAYDPSQALKAGYSGLTLIERYAFHGLGKRVAQILDILPRHIFHDRPVYENHKLLLLCAQQDWPLVVAQLRIGFAIEDRGRDDSGRTLAHWASELHWTFVDDILQSKPPLWLDLVDDNGCTALHIAAENRNESACRALLSAGADWRLKDKSHRLPIHIAAEQGHRSILLLLLEHPINPVERDLEKRHLLHYLVMWHSAIFLRQCLRILQPNIHVFDKRHRTPLHYAAIFGNTGGVKVLLDAGAAPDIQDASGFTPLHCALTSGSMLNVQHLLDAKANLHIMDKFQRNALHLAFKSENPAVINLVLRKMSLDHENLQQAVSHADIFGWTVLHRIGAWDTRSAQSNDDPDEEMAFLLDLGLDDAVISDLVVVPPQGAILDHQTVRRYVNILISLGACANASDIQGRSPLHVAIQNNNFITADALLSLPVVQLSLEDSAGCTVLDRAANDGQDRIIELLKASGASHSVDWRSKIRPLYAPWQEEAEEKAEDNALEQQEWGMVPVAAEKVSSEKPSDEEIRKPSHWFLSRTSWKEMWKRL